MKCIFCKVEKPDDDLWYIDHKHRYGKCSEPECMEDIKYLQEHYRKTCRPRRFISFGDILGKLETSVEGEVEDYEDYLMRILEINRFTKYVFSE